MSKSKTKTATTAHGTVEYETVECDSCGNEVAKSDAYRFLLFKQGRDPSFVKDDDKQAAGWACPYCFDTAPIEPPSTTPISAFMQWLKWATGQDNSSDALFVAIMGSIAMVMATSMFLGVFIL